MSSSLAALTAAGSTLCEMEGGAEITYVGHSSVLVAMDGVVLLTDPVLRRRIAHLRRAAPAAVALPRPMQCRLAGLMHLDPRSLRGLGDASGLSPRPAPGVPAAQGVRRRDRVRPGDESRSARDRAGDVRRPCRRPENAAPRGSRSATASGSRRVCSPATGFDGMADPARCRRAPDRAGPDAQARPPEPRERCRGRGAACRPRRGAITGAPTRPPISLRSQPAFSLLPPASEAQPLPMRRTPRCGWCRASRPRSSRG
jgi:hypothetical protein